MMKLNNKCTQTLSFNKNILLYIQLLMVINYALCNKNWVI